MVSKPPIQIAQLEQCEEGITGSESDPNRVRKCTEYTHPVYGFTKFVVMTSLALTIGDMRDRNGVVVVYEELKKLVEVVSSCIYKCSRWFCIFSLKYGCGC